MKKSISLPLKRRESAGYMVNWAARLFARGIDRKLRPHGVFVGHMPVFFALADGREMTQSALTARAAVEQPTMAATLKRMEREGLLARRVNPEDARTVLYALTSEGVAKLPAINAAAREMNALALGGMNATQQAEFMARLQEVVARLEAEEKK